MNSIDIPSGVTVEVKESYAVIKGKLGTTTKKINMKLLKVEVSGNKITVTPSAHKKLKRIAELAATALSSEIKEATGTVQTGIERKMKVLFAHFPMSVEVKAMWFTLRIS